MTTSTPRKKSKAQTPPVALARVEPAPLSTPLTAPQHKLFAEALRRAEETRDVMEDALVSFGRWVLVNIFDDDAAAALEGRAGNPVWVELLSRAGGPTMRLSRRLLFVAVHIAARDKRITDEAWRGLEPGRKELLLPLGDETFMRKAAQHVQAMKLSQRATRSYVDTLLGEQGRGRRARLTGARLATRVKRFSSGVTAAPFAKRAAQVAGDLPEAEREALRRDVTALQKWSTELLRVLRRKG